MPQIEDIVTRTVLRALARSLPGWPRARLCVAFSGGVDSTALLHACRAIRDVHGDLTLRALHVHHGLQPAAASWPAHCAALCAELAVPFASLDLALAPPPGASVEAAAREARYRALAAALVPGEALLTAHHEDDQLETVLLQLFRGAGVAGLAAMPAAAAFGGGWLLRPLLELRRADIEDYARRAGLPRIDDPANSSTRFDRGLLRREIVPRLTARWPSLSRTVARSARHAAVAQGLLDELAALDAEGAVDGARLAAARLQGLSRARQANLLRWWLRRAGLSLPSEARLAAIQDDLLTARAEAQPLVTWEGGEVRRHRGWLHAMRPLVEVAAGPWSLEPGHRLEIPGVGSVELLPAVGAGIRAELQSGGFEVSLQQGGERLRAQGHRIEKSVARLLRESGTPPWLRQRVPLVYGGGRLLAVGGQWIAAEAAAGTGQDGFRVGWSPAGGAG